VHFSGKIKYSERVDDPIDITGDPCSDNSASDEEGATAASIADSQKKNMEASTGVEHRADDRREEEYSDFPSRSLSAAGAATEAATKLADGDDARATEAATDSDAEIAKSIFYVVRAMRNGSNHVTRAAWNEVDTFCYTNCILTCIGNSEHLYDALRQDAGDELKVYDEGEDLFIPWKNMMKTIRKHHGIIPGDRTFPGVNHAPLVDLDAMKEFGPEFYGDPGSVLQYIANICPKVEETIRVTATYFGLKRYTDEANCNRCGKFHWKRTDSSGQEVVLNESKRTSAVDITPTMYEEQAQKYEDFTDKELEWECVKCGNIQSNLPTQIQNQPVHSYGNVIFVKAQIYGKFPHFFRKKIDVSEKIMHGAGHRLCSIVTRDSVSGTHFTTYKVNYNDDGTRIMNYTKADYTTNKKATRRAPRSYGVKRVQKFETKKIHFLVYEKDVGNVGSDDLHAAERKRATPTQPEEQRSAKQTISERKGDMNQILRKLHEDRIKRSEAAERRKRRRIGSSTPLPQVFANILL